MDRMSLEFAKRFVSAGSKRERLRMLASEPFVSRLAVARGLKDICYSVWTSNPAAVKKVSDAIALLSVGQTEPEIAAIKYWIDGIAAITRAELETAVTNLERSSAIYKKLGAEHESAQPLVAELIALAMLGRYDAAVRTGKRALRIFEKFGDELAAGKIELNLSNVVSRRERHRDAESFGTSARERFISIGETEWQTLAENSLANTYAELNEFRTAEKYYSEALKNARAARMKVTEAEIEASLGNLELLRGNYARALSLFESSRTNYEALGMPHQKAIAELEIADIYAELNLNSEAIEIYKRVAATLRKLKLGAEEARARANYGRAAMRIGKQPLARRQLVIAGGLYEKERNPVAAASVLLDVARIEKASGDTAAAERLTKKARSILAKSENPRRALEANWLMAELLRERSPGKARFAFDDLRRRALKLQNFGYYQSALAASAKIELASGNRAAARKLFEEAVASIETMRSPLPAEEFQIAFLADRLEPFQELMKLAIGDGRFAEAFVWLERFRARSLSDSMSTGGSGNPDIRFGNEIAGLREELNWHYKRLNTEDDGGADKTNRAIARLEKCIAGLSRRARSSATTDTKSRVSYFASKDLHLLQRRLGRSKALVEYVETDGEIGAFVVTDRGVEYFDQLISNSDAVSLSRSLRSQFAPLRHSNIAGTGLLKTLKARTDQVLGRLHGKLIAPISGAIGKRDLVLIPAGPLHLLPIHALHANGAYLIEGRNISYAPSAAVWSKLSEGRKQTFESALLMGYADEKIPMVHAEVRTIKGSLNKVEVRTGEQATIREYFDGSATKDIIHLACHGVFRADNPMFSSLHLSDGWMTANDISSHKISASVVTMSACETGLNELAAGDEILGLTRGFLSAGARNVVQSLWTVNDAATSDLMSHFYNAIQRGQTIRASLRQAQITMIEKGSHPYHWAPFVLIGG